MTALVTEHLPLVAGAPEGIKKLRELVLELAVSGRLVAQDASDESVDLLLRRIEVLKESKTISGTVKRQKAKDQLAAQPTHAIPASWRFVQLGEVVEIVRGITFPASEKSKAPSPGRIACLRTANVQDRIEWNDLLYIDESFVSRKDQFLQPHDIVMSMANSRELVGKVALVGGEPRQRSTFGGFLGVLRPHFIEPRFVMALLRTPSARSALIDSASQTTNIANISLGKLRPLMVALPPLAEQHRIVAKVDELMALCDRIEADQADAEAAHAQLVQALLGSLTQATDAAEFRAHWERLSEHFHTLFTTEASIDALKQTVLQLAFLGRLVVHRPSELIGQCVSAMPNSLDTNIVGTDAPTRAVPQQFDPLFELPPGWQWVSLSSVIASFANGLYKTAEHYADDGLISLRMFNIQEGSLDLSTVRRVRATDAEIAQFGLREGDILINRVNSKELVGKAAVVPASSQTMLFESMNMRARPMFDLVNPWFVCLWLRTVWARTFLVSSAKEAISQASINQTQVGCTPLPLAPLAEQHLIVATVDELMALCDQLKAQLADARQQHAQLATALIEQAVA